MWVLSYLIPQDRVKENPTSVWGRVHFCSGGWKASSPGRSGIWPRGLPLCTLSAQSTSDLQALSGQTRQKEKNQHRWRRAPCGSEGAWPPACCIGSRLAEDSCRGRGPRLPGAGARGGRSAWRWGSSSALASNPFAAHTRVEVAKPRTELK